MPTFVEIVAGLVFQCKTENAIKVLLDRYQHDTSKAYTAYNTWKRIRGHLAKDPLIFNSEYHTEVMKWLATNPGLSQPDFEAVCLFLQMSPVDQFYRLQRRRQVLQDSSHDKTFREIRPFISSFYDFVLPVEFQDANREQKAQRTRDRHFHKGKPVSYFMFTVDQVETIKAKCMEVLARDELVTDSDYFETFTALQIVSGRRNVEIQRELSCRPCPESEYQTSVFGLAKNIHRGSNWINIPLLCPFTLFDTRLTQLRLHAGMIFAKNQKIVSGLRYASRRLFGQILVHTQKRNLYAELAWADRETNRFMGSEEGCSKFTWIGNALGHVIDYAKLGPTASYQILTINNT